MVAMEKVKTEEFPQTLESHQIKAWKEEIQAMVQDFHEKGLVHGDLRPPNFIFVPGDTPKMLLVDFDWGGKEGKVCFPSIELVEGLRVRDSENPLLDQLIMKADDDRVLKETFKWLDERAESEMDLADG